ncbi:MAG TPA: hypothetical protein VGE65_02505 [Sphingobium sp.]
MTRALLAGFLIFAAGPLAAQATAPSPPASAAATPANPFTAEQITAFNAAVTTFTEGQKAQQAGDNATALTKYEAALPAIRDIVKAQPDNLTNVNFLANVLYAAAAANAGLGKMDALVPLYEESLPYWRQVVTAKPEMANRNVLTGILTQLGNVRLTQQDKAGATTFYTEALSFARQSVAEKADAQNRNLLLSALIGASQASEDEAVKTEVATLSREMIADGTVNPANKPAAQILAGSGAAPRAK